jgi:DNA repair photolyase
MSAGYIETTCKTAVNRVTGTMPFNLSLNPYRGCRHACAYCYARASHAYLGHDAGADFERIIYVKTNIADVLRAELRRGRWAGESIAIGTATDPYQPIEGRYRLMRGCLGALIDYGGRATIMTKGTLIVRDRDLLAALAAMGNIGVTISLITLDAAIWRALEPGTPPPRQRLRALEGLATAGIPAGIGLAPVLPALTDQPEALADLVRAAADHGAQWLWSGSLHLEPAVRDVLLAALAKHFPAAIPAVARTFGPAGSPAHARYTPRWQADALKERVAALKRQYGLDQRPRPQPSPRAIPAQQHQLALPW